MFGYQLGTPLREEEDPLLSSQSYYGDTLPLLHRISWISNLATLQNLNMMPSALIRILEGLRQEGN